jgi:hypothetical protein
MYERTASSLGCEGAPGTAPADHGTWQKGGPKSYRSADAEERLPLRISGSIEQIGVSYVLKKRDRPPVAKPALPEPMILDLLIYMTTGRGTPGQVAGSESQCGPCRSSAG